MAALRGLLFDAHQVYIESLTLEELAEHEKFVEDCEAEEAEHLEAARGRSLASRREKRDAAEEEYRKECNYQDKKRAAWFEEHRSGEEVKRKEGPLTQAKNIETQRLKGVWKKKREERSVKRADKLAEKKGKLVLRFVSSSMPKSANAWRYGKSASGY